MRPRSRGRWRGAGVSLLVCLALIATQRWHGRFTHDGIRGLQKFHTQPDPAHRRGGDRARLRRGSGRSLPARRSRPIWALIGLAGLPAFAAGLGEDLTSRSACAARLLATMAAGVVFALLTGYVMDEVDLPGVDWLLAFYLVALLFTGFAMGGVANAINIIDGFNGLAAGALLIMLGAFA